MSAHQFQSLKEIADTVCEQGFVDQAALTALEEHFNSHSTVDQSKADLLFHISAVVSSNPKTCSAWQALFLQSVCRFVVFDLNSPGEIAESEANWLRHHISDQREMTRIEVALIREIQRSANCTCSAMNQLFERARQTEQSLMPQPPQK